jgi:nucleotide-binding universal stress UspA family protein
MHAVFNPPYGDPRNVGIMMTTYIKEVKELAELWYVNSANMASNEDVKFTTETILDIASAADSIKNYAESKKADLIVIGAKGRTGIKRLLLGSVTNAFFLLLAFFLSVQRVHRIAFKLERHPFLLFNFLLQYHILI